MTNLLLSNAPPQIRSVLAAVETASGVARVGSLIAAGRSRYWIGEALTRGHLQRVRRGWVALPEADPELVAAARWGVVLSCVTAARRLGLWVLTEDRCHVAADPRSSGGKPDRATVHWARPVVERDPDALVDRVENILTLVATCQPVENALTVWESALRAGMVDAHALGRMALPSVARAVLAQASPFSDSGLETLFRHRLRWINVPIRAQIVILDRPVDFLIGDRLVVQIDGGHHVGAQRACDVAHDAQLAVLGYTVLRFTYRQVVDEWPQVQDAVMRAVAVRLHLPC